MLNLSKKLIILLIKKYYKEQIFNLDNQKYYKYL